MSDAHAVRGRRVWKGSREDEVARPEQVVGFGSTELRRKARGRARAKTQPYQG